MASKTIQDAISHQASLAPGAIAAVAGTQQVTYAELDGRANRLAWTLIEAGVLRGDHVGVMLDRSIEGLVASLAILKAGASYVPIDPTYPRKRIEYILADSRPKLVITAADTLRDLPALVYAYTMDEAISKAAPTVELEATDLAYVLYTAGSTGEPKGVMTEHRSLWNYLNWAAEAYSMAEGHGALVQSSLSLDFTVTTLFGPLLVGKTVFILPDAEVSSFIDELRRRRDLSIVKVLPSLLDVLARHMTASQLRGATRSVVISGGTVHSRQLRWWQEADPGTRFFNEYGTAETTVGCCSYEIPSPCPEGAIPIGTAISGARLCVLDDEARPVRPGTVGELYIAGDCVSKGYLNGDTSSAQRFLADPASALSRMYRSGDLVRASHEGVLEFVGRTDNQVTVRGYRIALEEVESVIRQHPEVEDVVAAVDQSAGQEQLIAYVRGTSSEPALHDFTSQYLPEHSVPSLFFDLDPRLLSSNGKVDRSLMPDPTTARRLASSALVDPESDLEKVIASVFAEFLLVDEVGATDNFLDLGGDSIIAALAVERLRGDYGITITMESFFEEPTVRGLAAAAAAAQ
ncbi:MAG TPA: non-ribosomal peptide synthetase [Candidatus Dormibacteraeota bacterium]